MELILLIAQYQQSEAPSSQKRIYNAYIKNISQINNWDLVDISAHKIVGHYLFDKDRKPLLTWAKARNMWKRRIAMVATFYFIKKQQYKETIQLAELFLKDKEDLIHKSTGWMLREVAKRDRECIETFLEDFGCRMPRTMLRYTIELFPEKLRRHYLESTREIVDF